MKITRIASSALAWLGGIAFGLIVVTCLVFLGINWHDQPVSEAAARLDKLYRERSPVADEENGYVYLVGFSVAKTEDPRAWGMKRIAWAKRLARQAGTEPILNFPGEDHDLTNARSASARALSEACRKINPQCLEVLNGDKHVADWLEEEEWLLARYKTLVAHPRWLETLPYDERFPIPRFSDIFEGQKLLLTQAWLLAGRGDAASVHELLDADVRFWRQSLEASDTLISRMIALASLKRHFAWANIVLRRLPSHRVMEAMPKFWLAPISDSERSMLRCLTGEWVFFNSIIRRTKESEFDPLSTLDEDSAARHLLWRMVKPMFQAQDTSNQYAKLLISISETLQVPYEQYPQAVVRARAMESEFTGNDFPSRIYNILGDAIFFINGPDFTSYAIKVADLEGLRRIAVLSAELRSQGVAAEQVPKKLSEAAVRNPYTGKPFLWDEKEKAIVFASFGPGESGRYAILY